MSDKQRTPQGQEIPVPTREDVLSDLKKVAKRPAHKQDSDARTRGSEQEQSE